MSKEKDKSKVDNLTDIYRGLLELLESIEQSKKEQEKTEEDKYDDFIRSQEVEEPLSDSPLVAKTVTTKSIMGDIQKIINDSMSYEEDVEKLTQLKKFVRKKLKRAKRKIKGIQEWEKETHAAQRPTETIGDLS